MISFFLCIIRYCPSFALQFNELILPFSLSNVLSRGGNLIANVTFENLNNATGCLENKALLFNPVSKSKSYDVSTSFENLSFDGAASDVVSKLSLCDAESNGVTNVLVSVDGSLLPQNSGSGVVVSNNPTLLANMKGCVDIPGACAKFCPMEKGACLRQITVAIVHHASRDLFLVSLFFPLRFFVRIVYFTKLLTFGQFLNWTADCDWRGKDIKCHRNFHT
jgi:hypothetical protein